MSAPEIDWDAIHEALESMDDFARMDCSVNPYGPYALLRSFITQAKGMQERLDELEPIPYEVTDLGKALLAGGK